jgi:hypothetical protein
MTPDHQQTTARAKIVARILTDNGHPVDPPDGGSLDDVEMERWKVCVEIARALEPPYRCNICGGRVDLADAVKPTAHVGPGGQRK